MGKALLFLIPAGGLRDTFTKHLQDNYSLLYADETAQAANDRFGHAAGDWTDFESLYRAADRALYCVKNNGKGAVMIYAGE